MTCPQKPSADGVEFSYIEEVDCGTTPDNPEFKKIGITGETLSRNVSNTESSEIYADMNARDTVQTGVEASGGVSIEWRINALKAFAVGGIRGGSAVVIDATDNFGVDATDQAAVALSATAATNNFAGALVGQSIRLSGFAEAGNNGIVRVVSVTDDDNIVVAPVEGQTMATESGSGAAVYAENYVNGTTPKSFTLQKVFRDMATPTFFRFEGQQVGTFGFSFGAQSIATGEFSFLGLSDSESEAELTGATYLAASSDSILNTVDSIGTIYSDGVAFPYSVMSMNLNIDNGARGQTAIGTAGFVGIGKGEMNVTGDIEVYFESLAFYQDFKNQKHVSIEFVLTDTEGNALAVSLPNVKYTELPVNATGKDSDVMAAGSFKAHYDESIGGTIQLTWLNKVA